MRAEDFFQIKTIGDKAIITGCHTPVAILDIPEKVILDGRQYTVVEIADKAFYGNQEINYVSIPASVTKVGIETFSRCDNLTEMCLKDGKMPICYHDTEFDEFRPPIKNLYLGRNILVSDSSFCPFNSCPTLTDITIGDQTAIIGECAFIDCVNITTIKFGKNLINIGEGAFMNSLSLKAIELPEGVHVIEKWAFKGCEKLRTARVAQKTIMRNNAFEDCHKEFQLTRY